MNNYYPKKKKEIEIPDFLQKNQVEDAEMIIDEEVYEETVEEQQDLTPYHLKELGKQVDAFKEDEAKIAAKHLISNYPDIVIDEIRELIIDMQELSGAILSNSREFVRKRGE